MTSRSRPLLAMLTDVSKVADGGDRYGAGGITSSSRFLSARRSFDSGPRRVTDFTGPVLRAQASALAAVASNALPEGMG
jgi:hypothetical protein